MRFAISAVAAASGLALLGLAMFGQPNTYLRQAREQWDSLLNIAPPEVMPEQDGDPRTAAMADKVAQLQQQLAQLRDELAANRTDAEQARQALAVAQAQRQAEEEQQQANEISRAAEAAQQPAAVPPVTMSPAAPQVPPNSVPGQPAVSAPEPFAAPIVATPESPAAPVQSQAVVPPPPQTPAAPPSQVPAQTLAQTLAQTPPPVAAPAQSQTTPIQVPAQSQMTPPQVPAQVAAQTQSQSQASARTGERRESATIERRQAADRREPVTERRDTAVPEHREAAAAERREAARVPPPVTRSPRPEGEDAQSVLARLRQITPGAAPVQDLPQQAERPVRGPSPWLKRLIAARAALAAGQIEDGRRLLQEVQLQLVFRPVNAAEDSAAAGRAARDVAHALEALAGNDLVQSRNYIDRAVGDGTGGAGEAPGREAASPHAGYAPAYPPY